MDSYITPFHLGDFQPLQRSPSITPRWATTVSSTSLTLPLGEARPVSPPVSSLTANSDLGLRPRLSSKCVDRHVAHCPTQFASVINPSNGKLITKIAEGTKADVDDASSHGFRWKSRLNLSAGRLCRSEGIRYCLGSQSEPFVGQIEPVASTSFHRHRAPNVANFS